MFSEENASQKSGVEDGGLEVYKSPAALYPPNVGVLYKIALWKIILMEIHTTILVPLSFPNKIDFLLQQCFNITSVRTISKQIDRISLISNKKQSGWVWQRHL